LQKLQFCIGWLIDNAFGFGGELFASVSDESGHEANNGGDMSNEFHGFKLSGGWLRRLSGICKLSVHTGREETPNDQSSATPGQET
jgi:hypothetical protein